MEKTWEYNCDLNFYGQRITKFTITDHYQINHSGISLDFIVELVKKINNKELEVTNYLGRRKVFRWRTTYRNKTYRLIFWFKDNEPNHLWVRNCYQVS